MILLLKALAYGPDYQMEVINIREWAIQSFQHLHRNFCRSYVDRNLWSQILFLVISSLNEAEDLDGQLL